MDSIYPIHAPTAISVDMYDQQLPQLDRQLVEQVFQELDQGQMPREEQQHLQLLESRPVSTDNYATDYPYQTYCDTHWDQPPFCSPLPLVESNNNIYQPSLFPMNSSEYPQIHSDVVVPSPAKKKRRTRRCLTLWRYLLQLLCEGGHEKIIRWQDQEQGIFTIVHSKKLASMWGTKKNHPDMTYEHLARAIRHYYRLEIMTRIPGKRLVYQFGQNATGWRTMIENNLQSTWRG